MLFSEAIPKFTAWKQYASKQRTAYSYGLNIKQFALYMKNPHIEDITYEDVIAFLNTMTDLGWDKNSYLGKCMAIKKFFEFYKKQKFEVLDSELIPIPDREYKFPKVLKKEDYIKLQEATNGNQIWNIRNKAIISLLWDCGLRVGELCSLNTQDIDLVNMKTVIKTEKSKGIRPIRQIMWTKTTNENLKKWMEKRSNYEEDALFVGVRTTNRGRRLEVGGVAELMRKLAEKTGVKNCNPHAFRHAFGRDLAVKGANNSVISSLMGHASVQSSYVYTVMDDKLMQEQYEKYRR